MIISMLHLPVKANIPIRYYTIHNKKRYKTAIALTIYSNDNI